MKKMKMKLAALAIAAAALLSLATPAVASQGSCVLPTTGTVSGLTLVQDINACIEAQMTQNSGATAPTNGTGGVSLLGQLWLRTTDKAVLVYDGAAWLQIGVINSTSSIWQPPVGGGTATIASATTTDLGSTSASQITVSGTTTITSFSNTAVAGQIKALTFSGALTLTHNATSLILPNNGSNIPTAAGDSAWAVYLGGGNWKVIAYQRADGTALSTSSVFTGAVFFDSPQTMTLASNTNDWNPTGLVSANVLRLTCSSAINVTGLVAPATDGKIIVIDNVGATNNCTLTAQDANSTAANRFAFDRAIAVRPGRSVTIKYDSTGARWRLTQEVTAQPIAGGFKNLKVTNDPASATTLKNNMLVTADEVTLEDTSGGAVRISSLSCSADVTASGAAGLDTGTVASATWYYLWVIYAPATNTTSCVHSLQSAAGSITKPSGYTFVARLGANYTNATTAGCTFNSANSACFSRILQYGRRAQYVVTASSATAQLPLLVAAGVQGSASYASPTYASVTTSVVVPATASMIGVMANMNYNALGNSNILVAPNGNYGGSGSTNQPPLNKQTTVGSEKGTYSIWLTLESANISAFADGAGFALQAVGWEDNIP